MKTLSRRVRAMEVVGTLSDLERKSWLVTADKFEHLASDADAETKRIATGMLVKFRRAARTGVEVKRQEDLIAILFDDIGVQKGQKTRGVLRRVAKTQAIADFDPVRRLNPRAP
jgi:hypothetical protein